MRDRVHPPTPDGREPGSRESRAFRWAAVVWLLGLAGLSVAASIPGGVSSLLWAARLPGRDKTVHFVLMGGLALFAVLGFEGARVAGRRLSAPAVLGAVVLIVAFEEGIQLWLPLRAFSLEDFGWSLAGVFCLGGGAAGWRRWTRRRATS